METKEFKDLMYKSFGLQTIIAGVVSLIEDEGYTPYEALELLNDVKKHTAPAMFQIHEKKEMKG